ncbi:LexA family transcriptional regulator [Methylobacterium sp. E-025]|uniref:LexA family transcriptional regulator n=1 Tax=Methylobacterium sp. E-025 TaxID=2836561 RepID=UPI001FBA8DC9|nr:LexA family transcriptional regulator [Methylobacterium sp. E-025]MCJ2112750.1 LexA family transcriptional regulator [Methylobacterium sp. E-025]
MALRLEAAIEAAGGKAHVSREAQVPLSSLDRYVRAKSEAPSMTLARIAKACGVTVDYLVFGNRIDAILAPALIDVKPSTETQIVLSEGKDTDEDSGFVAIPHLEIRASAGPGLASSQLETDAPRQIAFRQSWLRSLGISPSNAEFIEARGDSMFPTIQDGDLMLLDRGYGEVVNGKIYVLVVNGLVVVKRVSLLAFGGLMLISDNDRYPAETVARDEVNNLNFQARVAWFGRPI